MTKAILRWLVPLTALLVLGPVAGLLTGSLHAPDGGRDVTPLVCDAPLQGVLAVLGAMAVALVAGLIAARLLGARPGLFAAGLVLAWAAWGTGTIDNILRRTGSGSVLWTLSLEGVLVGALGVAVAAAILAVARRRHGPAGEHGEHSSASAAAHGYADEGPTGLLSTPNLIGLAFAVVAGAAGAWFVAAETLKGQTFAAGAVAGLLAAAVGRLSAHRAPAVLFFIAIALLAAVSPASATALHFGAGPSDAVHAAYANTLLPIARLLPLDWVAGAFVGVPLGLSWAGSMLERHTPGQP